MHDNPMYLETPYYAVNTARSIHIWKVQAAEKLLSRGLLAVVTETLGAELRHWL